MRVRILKFLHHTRERDCLDRLEHAGRVVPVGWRQDQQRGGGPGHDSGDLHLDFSCAASFFMNVKSPCCEPPSLVSYTSLLGLPLQDQLLIRRRLSGSTSLV